MFRNIISSFRPCHLRSAIQLSRNYCQKFGQVERTVFISKSNNIYENLAFEDWIFKNFNFENKEVLMLWVNSPCVVFGRHQNPWSEVDLNYLLHSGIMPARRNSGGGTVYHDLGNLNCTFFSSRKSYNRKKNLTFLCDVLKKKWDLQLEISNREDILLDGKFKISGTASKLANQSSYHHCTLLISSDFKNLSQVLTPPQLNIQSKATSSIPSAVINLQSINPDISVNIVQDLLSHRFLGTAYPEESRFQCVMPNDLTFPGWGSGVDWFKNWNWVYAKSPKFSALLPFSSSSSLRVDVENGKIVNATFEHLDDSPSSYNIEQIFLGAALDISTMERIFTTLNDGRSKLKFDRARFFRSLAQLFSTRV